MVSTVPRDKPWRARQGPARRDAAGRSIFTTNSPSAQAAAKRRTRTAARIAAESLNRAKPSPTYRERIEKDLTAARDHAKAAIDAQFDRIQQDFKSSGRRATGKLEQLKDYLCEAEGRAN